VSVPNGHACEKFDSMSIKNKKIILQIGKIFLYAARIFHLKIPGLSP
jgi:hypothetical protein